MASSVGPAKLVSRLVDPPDYALAILLHDADPAVRPAAMLYQQTY
jgi:hypothetical protein